MERLLLEGWVPHPTFSVSHYASTRDRQGAFCPHLGLHAPLTLHNPVVMGSLLPSHSESSHSELWPLPDPWHHSHWRLLGSGQHKVQTARSPATWTSMEATTELSLHPCVSSVHCFTTFSFPEPVLLLPSLSYHLTTSSPRAALHRSSQRYFYSSLAAPQMKTFDSLGRSG